MDPSQSNTARRTAPTPPPLGATPERSPHPAPRRPRTTRNDARIPAESVRVTDHPADGRGRAYLVERELEKDGNAALQALVADYVEQAERHGQIPMHFPLGRYLAYIEA